MLLCVLAFASQGSTAAGISLTDDTGRRVELKAPAQRVVTLAPFLTELAFSVGAGDRLVGVSAHSDFPPEARGLPQVSSAVGFSMEPIVALRPDLAIVWKDSARSDEIERLRRLGIAVFVSQARSLEDVPRLLRAVATLTGRDAGPVIGAYRARLERLRAAHAASERLPVLLEIWHRPLTTIGGPHWMNEALELCGARNAFAQLPGIAPQMSWEDVYARNPSVIVGAGSAPDEQTFRANWKERATLPAVQRDRLVFIHGDLIQRPTARLADGVERLCAGLDRLR